MDSMILNYFIQMFQKNINYPLPGLPPGGKENFSPLGEIRKGVSI